MRLICNREELIQELKSTLPKGSKVGYMSLFFEDVHPGHCYALLKLNEVCDKTIAIPLINKQISYEEAVKYVKGILHLIPADYVYLPSNAIQYEKPELINEINTFVRSRLYNDFLSNQRPILDMDTISRCYKVMPFAAPRCSISYTDMKILGEEGDFEIVSIRGNKDVHQDLQVYLRCGLENLSNIPETSLLAASLIRKQKRIFCYTWRDPSFFPIRRNSKYLQFQNRSDEGIDPSIFPEQINEINEIYDIIIPKKLRFHNYYLVAMSPDYLLKQPNSEDYNNRKVFLIISSYFSEQPYFPNDFIHLNFGKQDALEIQGKDYIYKKDYFSKELDSKIDNIINVALDNVPPEMIKKFITEEMVKLK